MQQPIRIIIADTAFIIRKGLRTLIQEVPEFEYITEAVDLGSLHKAMNTHRPDVLIVDHCCDDCFELNEIKTIKDLYPTCHILVISHVKTADEIKKVIGIGIRNYLMKDCDEQEIKNAITSCARGENFFCGQIIDVLLDKEFSMSGNCDASTITDRELEIILLLISGKRPKEIACTLNISPFTVNTHKKNIYKKLGINHSYELAQYAFKSGLMK